MPETDNARLAYSVEELARLTGKTAPAIRADIDRGVLKARRWGRRVVLLHEDVVAFLHGLPEREV
jgi:excisionase family DNA binding protein